MNRTSFRDPAGYVRLERDRALRFVRADFVNSLDTFLGTNTAARLTRSGQLISTRRLHDDEGGRWYEHERVEFLSYPFEWPPIMLHAAALLTLTLAESLLDEGMGLKDATPFNVLFRGSTPVFVDVLSAVRRDPADTLWTALAQFERTFVLPLIAWQMYRIDPAMIFHNRREGLEPADLFSASRWSDVVRPLFLWNVIAPMMLERAAVKSDVSAKIHRTEPEIAQYALRMMFRRLRRLLRKLEPEQPKSRWTAYGRDPVSYAPAAAKAKEEFVRGVMARARPGAVLDLGCNTGTYAHIAARSGARVVAVDRDRAVVAALWAGAREVGADILPLVVDIARPTPATGWMGMETLSFLERLDGQFDMVFALALMHHLMISERLPMDEVAALLARCTSRMALVEYVGPRDALFRELARGRESLYSDFSRAQFEEAFNKYFEVMDIFPTGEDRAVFELKKRL